MMNSSYEPNAKAKTGAATPIVSRTFLGKLATPTFALLSLNCVLIAFDQLWQQESLRALDALAMAVLAGNLAWYCRIAYRRKPHN